MEIDNRQQVKKVATRVRPRVTGAGVKLRSRVKPRATLVIRLMLLALVLLPMAGLPTRAIAQAASEYEVKAGYLYNFITFTEWPADAIPNGSIVIGVVGDDPFGRAIDAIVRGKTVNGRSIQIRRIGSGQDCRGCQVLFIAASEKRHYGKILDSLRGTSTLTVADMDGFARDGGVINFFIEERRVKFEININAAARARLKLSSRMLKSARIING